MTPLELEDIATELREGRPAPTPNFAAELDAWAAEGFPPARTPSRSRPVSRPRSRRDRQNRRWMLPAFGVAATAALVIGVVLSQRDAGSGTYLSGEDNSSGGYQREVVPAVKPQGPSSLDSSGAGKGLGAPPASSRIQEKSASMTLSAASGDVADVAQDASDVTQRYDGIVDTMDVRTNANGEARASLQLRIPTQNLAAALGELSSLGRVESRDEALTDITKSYNGAAKRFNHAQARVNELLAALAATSDPGEIAGLKAELRVARQRLASARAVLRDQKQHGNFAHVSLTVVSRSDDSGWSLGDAADDAVNVLEAIAGATLIALAVAIPVGSVGAALWFGSAGLRRRRRESVLDD
jgi:uncharacterized protein DUF4349